MQTKILLLTLVLLSITRLGFGQCANTANIYSFSYGGHSYEIVKEMKSWTVAAACAVERGGYLVQINDQAEQNYIYSQIAAAGISTTYTQVIDGGGTAYIWIGATDKFTEGAWFWDGTNGNTGTNFWNGQGAAGSGGGSAVSGAFVNWGGKSTGIIKEPDNYFYQTDQDAAAIALAGWPSGTTMLGIGGEWNDIAISNTIYYIIEKDNSSSPCQSPTSLGVYNINTASASIYWTSTAPNFEVRYKPTTSSTWQSTTSANDTVILASLTKNTNYEFQVKAICSASPSDTSSWSSLANFTTLNDVGLNDISSNFTIFPNPIKSEILRIEFTANKFKKIEIMDITGNSIIHAQVNNQSILNLNLAAIPTGVYFIKFITNADEILIRKLIKN